MAIGTRDIVVGLALLGAALVSLEAVAREPKAADAKAVNAQSSKQAMEMRAKSLEEAGALPYDPNLVSATEGFGELAMRIQQAANPGNQPDPANQQNLMIRAPAQQELKAAQ